MIVMLGLVDTHRHMWQASCATYCRTVRWRTIATSCNAPSVPNTLPTLSAIESGVTCILDWSHIHNTPAHTDAAVKGLFDSGVRAFFAYGNGGQSRARPVHPSSLQKAIRS
jgi:hypothetical protein